MLRSKSRQRGVFLLALVLIMFVMGSTVMLASLNNRRTTISLQQSELHREMQAAKQALLAYASTVAANFGDGPGHLPCPDLDVTDNDPTPEPNCNPATQFMGRLPQYIELTDLPVDASTGTPQRFYLGRAFGEFAQSDQALWYAVSPAYLHTATGSLQANTNTTGALSLDGATDIVALVIAPGEALAQDRASGLNDYAQYMEGGNGLDDEFWTYARTSDGYDPALFNDVVIPITRAELWSVATLDVAKAVKVRLDDHWSTCSSYPRAIISPNTCGLNLSTALTNFRTAMNSTTTGTPAPTWMMSTSGSITGEQNWMGVVSSYSYNSGSGNAVFAFTGCTAMTFTVNHTVSTITRNGTDC